MKQHGRPKGSKDKTKRKEKSYSIPSCVIFSDAMVKTSSSIDSVVEMSGQDFFVQHPGVACSSAHLTYHPLVSPLISLSIVRTLHRESRQITPLRLDLLPSFPRAGAAMLVEDSLVILTDPSQLFPDDPFHFDWPYW